MNNKINIFDEEYECIKNEIYKNELKKIINMLPDYFFDVAASSTGKYHPSFSLGVGGLVRHSKAAFRIGKELLDNNSLGHRFTDKEKDLLLISILIHDGFKHGYEYDEYTKFEHPILIANFIKDNKDKFSFTDEEIDFISSAVASHMGEWNTNKYSNTVLPKPLNKYQRFVHMCDFLASRKFLDIKFENNNIVE